MTRFVKKTVPILSLLFAATLFFQSCKNSEKDTAKQSQTVTAEVLTLQPGEVRYYLVVNLVVAAFVNSFYHSFFFFEQWKAKVIESNQLQILSHQLKENAL